jgi:hypothetical protein
LLALLLLGLGLFALLIVLLIVQLFVQRRSQEQTRLRAAEENKGQATGVVQGAEIWVWRT